MSFEHRSNSYTKELSTPYTSDVYTIRKYGAYIQKIIWLKACRESGWESDQCKQKRGTANTTKLDNNLSRAKATVKELAQCNDWDYWCTFTLDKTKLDRYDLEVYKKRLGEFIHNYNRRCSPEEKVQYLLVPEMHKDGAWHMHGFIKGIRKKDLYVNKDGYLTWKQYEDKFGFISMSVLRDKDKCSSYITKYMTKDALATITKLNAHAYYASHGLKRSEVLYRGSGKFKGEWDWEHEDGYCKVKTIDSRKESLDKYFEMMYDDKPKQSKDTDVSDFDEPVRKISKDDGFRPWYDLDTGEIFSTPFDGIPIPGWTIL